MNHGLIRAGHENPMRKRGREDMARTERESKSELKKTERRGDGMDRRGRVKAVTFWSFTLY